MRWLLVICIVGLLLVVGGCVGMAADTPTPGPEVADGPSGNDTAVEGELEIHHIDVGQADATLLVTPDNETVLVDTGDWRADGQGVIAYLENHSIDRIDHLVATHPHADHIGGHAAIIEHFEGSRGGIGAIYGSGVPHDTATFENYLDAIDRYGHELLLVEKWGEQLEADVYQAGHHGSSTSSSRQFLDAVDPEIAVISSEYDSRYGHPHDDVLSRFDEMDVETYWTGVHGNVVLTTDGTCFDVETREEFSSDPAKLSKEKPGENETADAVDWPGIETGSAPIPG